MTNNRKTSRQKNRKLVIVGDGMCGKTSLLYAFMHGKFDSTHTLTIFDSYPTDIEVDNKRITLTLSDTAGEDDFDRFRPFAYPDTNVVLICFCVNEPSSAINVIDKWSPEIRHFCDQCPVILVACKVDLRTDPQTIIKLRREGEIPISTEVGQKLTAQIQADAYVECSAKSLQGIQELFLTAVRLSLEKRSHRRERSKCSLY